MCIRDSRFSKPLFQTREVLVQNKNSQPIKDMAQLDGKEIYIPKSAVSYTHLDVYKRQELADAYS